MPSELKKKLMSALRGKIPPGLLHQLPSRYPIIGGAVLLRLKPQLLPYGKIIGEAILAITGARSVWTFIGPAYGVERRVRVVHLAGERNPVVTHRELNTLFRVDISKLTFSPGNAGERARLIRLMGPDDVVFDPFCCCGNLSMPVAVNVKPRAVIGLEINPLAYRYLLETIRLNRVSHIFRAYNMDNHYWTEEEFATQVLLGYLPKPDAYQTAIAFRSVSEEGVVHYHVAARASQLRREILFLRRLASKLKMRVVNITVEKVKEVAPRLTHYVIRIALRR